MRLPTFLWTISYPELGYFLFRSLFRDSKVYRKIVEQLSKKTKGMSRQEIIQECGITDNGKLSEILENLCNCDFIRRYSSFNKRQREAIYQLTDLFSLFHLRYIKDANGMDDRFWTDAIDSPSHRRANCICWRGCRSACYGSQSHWQFPSSTNHSRLWSDSHGCCWLQ